MKKAFMLIQTIALVAIVIILFLSNFRYFNPKDEISSMIQDIASDNYVIYSEVSSLNKEFPGLVKNIESLSPDELEKKLYEQVPELNKIIKKYEGLSIDAEYKFNRAYNEYGALVYRKLNFIASQQLHELQIDENVLYDIYQKDITKFAKIITQLDFLESIVSYDLDYDVESYEAQYEDNLLIAKENKDHIRLLIKKYEYPLRNLKNLK